MVNSHDTHFLLLTNLSGTFAGSTCTPTSLSSMLLAALTWVLGSSWVLNTWLPPTFLLNTPTERIKYQRGFYFDIKKKPFRFKFLTQGTNSLDYFIGQNHWANSWAIGRREVIK